MGQHGVFKKVSLSHTYVSRGASDSPEGVKDAPDQPADGVDNLLRGCDGVLEEPVVAEGLRRRLGIWNE